MRQHEPLQLRPNLAQPIINRLQRSPRHVLRSLTRLDILTDLKVVLQQASQQRLSLGRFEELALDGTGDDELAVDALVLDRAKLGKDVGRVGCAGAGAGGDRGEETTEGDEALVDRCELGGELGEGGDEGFEKAVCARVAGSQLELRRRKGEGRTAVFPLGEEKLRQSFFALLDCLVFVVSESVAARDDVLELGEAVLERLEVRLRVDAAFVDWESAR